MHEKKWQGRGCQNLQSVCNQLTRTTGYFHVLMRRPCSFKFLNVQSRVDYASHSAAIFIRELAALAISLQSVKPSGSQADKGTRQTRRRRCSRYRSSGYSQRSSALEQCSTTEAQLFVQGLSCIAEDFFAQIDASIFRIVSSKSVAKRLLSRHASPPACRTRG